MFMLFITTTTASKKRIRAKIPDIHITFSALKATTLKALDISCLYKTPIRTRISVAWTPSLEERSKLDKIGGKYLITMIPGFGESNRLVDALAGVLLCSGAPLMWEVLDGDFKDDEDFKNMITSIKRNCIAIKGNTDPYEAAEITSRKIPMTLAMRVRRTLDLHAFIMEIKSFRGLHKLMHMHKNIDVTVFRQNTEGDYMMLEHSPVRDESVVELLRVVTKNNSERLAESAFQYARRKNRSTVQCLHRSGSLPMSEGIFVDGFKKVAMRYPDIKHEILEFRAAFWFFLKNSKYLDVVVTSGLDGLMLSNYLFGLLGSPNLVAGMNFGREALVMEPASRQRDADPNPNPTAYFLCGSALLDYLGYTKHAEMIRESIEETFIDNILTSDLGGNATLVEFTSEVIKRIRKKKPYITCAFDSPPMKKIIRHKPKPFLHKPEPFLHKPDSKS